jgi:hypothetical protein
VLRYVGARASVSAAVTMCRFGAASLHTIGEHQAVADAMHVPSG